MTQEEVRQFLREMGFSEPCPEYTMSKRIPLKTGEIISLQVWASKDPYVYFSTPKGMSGKYPFELLGIDYDGALYPKVICKEDVENICFQLTGKSIYDIDIKEPEGLREELLANYDSIINYRNSKPIRKKSFFKRLFA